MDMYEHDEDGDGSGSFRQFMEGVAGSPIISVNLPVGETLVVNGPRLTPVIITISNTAEKSPKRDARMLASYLTCSLDEQTVFYLAEYLFAEHISPMMQTTKDLVAQKMAPAKSPRKKEKELPEDEY